MVTERRLNRIKKAVANKQEGIIVLQDIHDRHNAQAVIRSCECFGIQKVYLIFEKEKQFNPTEFGKLASSSANKWLEYEAFESTQVCFEKLKLDGYHIIATALTDDSVSIYETDFASNKKIALCFGNEKDGLTKEAVEAADQVLNIPMHGMIQSLNLSVTAALCLFEMTRQRKEAGFENFSLETKVQKALIDKFLVENCN
jgi:tRNA (guanosine-2'-O-)-methyltransferase